MADGGVSELSALFALFAATPEAGAATAGTFAAADAIPAAVSGAEATIAAATPGLSVGSALQIGSAVAGVAGTAGQLAAGAPKPPKVIAPPQVDQAQLEADRRNELLKRKGRAANLLTAGGAQGDQSTPNLGAAALLGSG